MPKEDTKKQFINYRKHLRAPTAICTGFESNLKQVEKSNRDNADASYKENLSIAYCL